MTEARWERIPQMFPMGSLVRGRVVERRPFGVFVQLPGVPFKGLVLLPSMHDRPRRADFQPPEVGDEIEAVVLGYSEPELEVRLSMRPSDLARARGS